MQKEVDSMVSGDKQINEKYLINQKIGEGCFGSIYDAINRKTFRRCALKMELLEPHLHNQTLNKEFMILMDLNGVQGIPKCYSIHKSDRHMVIEMQLLDKDMHTILKQRKNLTAAEVCRLGVQIIKVFKEVHARKIVHRDIKPQNIMVDAKGKYYLVDFGIASTLRDEPKNRKKLRKLSANDSLFVGTPRYASVGAHCNQPQTPLDDIESLLYVLVFLATQKLPWVNLRVSNKQKIYQIGHLKQTTSRKDLCKNLPECFLLAFAYLDRLNSYKQLDHNKLIELLTVVQSQKKIGLQQHKDYVAKGRHIKSESLRNKKRCSIDKTVNRLSLPKGNPPSTSTSQHTDKSTMKMTQKLVLNLALGFTTFRQPQNFDQTEEVKGGEMKLEDKLRELTDYSSSPKLKGHVDTRAGNITF